MSTAKTATSFWRIAGMSYLQYVSKASTVIRNNLKEPARRKALQQEHLSYNAAKWEAGAMGTKTPVSSLPEAGSV